MRRILRELSNHPGLRFELEGGPGDIWGFVFHGHDGERVKFEINLEMSDELTESTLLYLKKIMSDPQFKGPNGETPSTPKPQPGVTYPVEQPVAGPSSPGIPLTPPGFPVSTPSPSPVSTPGVANAVSLRECLNRIDLKAHSILADIKTARSLLG